jgi:hypothetical protein
VRQRSFGLGHKSADDLAYCQDFFDPSRALTCREQALMLTAGLGRRDDLTPQAISVSTRLLALGAPLLQERSGERA